MKTGQIFPRTARLALTITIGALCLCARCQNLTLSIAPAVHVTWPTTTNKAYQVETSTNILLRNWAPSGGRIEGTGDRVGAYFEAGTAAQFFKIQASAASGLNWLEGVWQG